MLISSKMPVLLGFFRAAIVYITFMIRGTKVTKPPFLSAQIYIDIDIYKIHFKVEIFEQILQNMIFLFFQMKK